MNMVSKTIMTGFLMLIPALSQADTSISCAVRQGIAKSVSIGVNLKENATSDYVTLSGNRLGQGSFSFSRIDFLEDETLKGRVITLSNQVTGAKMEVFSEDFQKNTPGMYTGEAKINVGEVQTTDAEVTYCTIIVDHKD